MNDKSSLVSQMARAVERHHRVVLLWVTLVTVIAGYRTIRTYQALHSDLEELLPESAPSVAALKAARQRLPGLRHLGIVIDTGPHKDVAAAERFVTDLSERLQKYPKDMIAAVRTNLSVERQFFETYALQLMDPSDVRRLKKAVELRRDWQVSHELGLGLDDDDAASPPPIPWKDLQDKYRKRYGASDRLSGDYFVSRDKDTVVIVVQTASHATSYESDHRLLSKVQGDVASLGFPGAYDRELRVGYAGDVAARVEEMQGLIADLGLASAIVGVLVAAVIVWFFRSWTSLLVLGIPLTCGTLWAFGLAALWPLRITSLNSNTAFLGSIVIGNGINSGIILLARYQEERGTGLDQRAAMDRAIETTWRPTLAASLAAAVSYGSLVFTEFRGFNQFGWIGGFGMILCWLAMFLLVPIFATRLDPVRHGVGSVGSWSRAAAFLVARPRAVVVVTLLAVVASGVGIWLRRANLIEYDLSRLRRRDSWQNGERYWGHRMDTTLERYLTPVVIMTPNGRAARLVEQRIERLKDEGAAGGLIGRVRSAASVLPPDRAESLQQARALKAVLTPRLLQDLDPDARRHIDRALSARALTELTVDDIPSSLAVGLRDNQGRIDRNVLLFPRLSPDTWNSQRIMAFTRDVRAAATIDGRAAPVAGSLPLSSDIASAMRSDGPKATAISLCTVLVIALLAFRSLWLSLSAAASLLIGVSIMLGVLAALGAKLNFSNFVALPITFGIAADYSVNMLRRFQADGGNDPLKAVLGSGGAVGLCSATTIIGFGSLLLAQNRALFSFGVFAVTGEAVCLATAVIGLPAALSLVQRRRAGP